MTKATATKNLPAVPSWEKEMAKYAQEETAATPAATGGNWISLQGQVFTYKQQAVGREMDVIVLAVAYENSFYRHKFNKENRQPPACFAIAPKSDILRPSDISPEKQGGPDGACLGCWANAFGSGEGRGKACGNRVRLAVVPSGDVLDPPKGDDGAAAVEIALMRIPPTSLKYWFGYAHKVNRGGVATFAVVTKLALKPSGATYLLEPSLIEPVRDPKAGKRILELRQLALEEILVPFDVTGYDAASATAKPAERATRGKSTAQGEKKVVAAASRFAGANKRKF